MIQRYDLTYDVATEDFDITPVPESHKGRFVAYEDYESLLKLNESLTKEIEQYRERIKAAELVVKNFSDIIEQSKKTVAQKEEAWTVWRDGENPVPGKMVMFELRFGYKSKSPALSDDLRWKRKMIDCPSASDIIKYRVVKEG